MNKVVANAQDALADIVKNNQSIAVGGFGLCGIPAGRQLHGGWYRAAGADGTIGHWRGYHGDSDPFCSLRTSATHRSVLSETA